MEHRGLNKYLVAVLIFAFYMVGLIIGTKLTEKRIKKQYLEEAAHGIASVQ